MSGEEPVGGGTIRETRCRLEVEMQACPISAAQQPALGSSHHLSELQIPQPESGTNGGVLVRIPRRGKEKKEAFSILIKTCVLKT